MTGGERDERFEGAAHRDRHAVVYVAGDRVVQRAELVHRQLLYLLRRFSSTALADIAASSVNVSANQRVQSCPLDYRRATAQNSERVASNVDLEVLIQCQSRSQLCSSPQRTKCILRSSSCGQRKVLAANIDMARAALTDQLFDQLHQRFSCIQIFFARRRAFESVDELRAGVVAQE